MTDKPDKPKVSWLVWGCVAVLALLPLYLLTWGVCIALDQRDLLSEGVVDYLIVVYSPLEALMETRPSPLGEALWWYANLWD